MNNFLREKAEHIRNRMFEVACKNKAGHIASSLSCLEILVYLYYKKMKPFSSELYGLKCMDEGNMLNYFERDRLIFSKAHGGYALYAILNDLGIIPDEVFEDMGKSTSILRGCVEYKPEYGLEAGCGSLGHGLPIAAGIAYGAKLNGHKYKIYCIMGDGELQEGTTWETLDFISKHRLGNLFIIVDCNGLRAMDTCDEIWQIRKKLEGYTDFYNCVIDGHDFDSIDFGKESTWDCAKIYLADTLKGNGIPCMENEAKFHYRIPGCIIE